MACGSVILLQVTNNQLHVMMGFTLTRLESQV